LRDAMLHAATAIRAEDLCQACTAGGRCAALEHALKGIEMLDRTPIPKVRAVIARGQTLTGEPVQAAGGQPGADYPWLAAGNWGHVPGHLTQCSERPGFNQDGSQSPVSSARAPLDSRSGPAIPVAAPIDEMARPTPAGSGNRRLARPTVAPSAFI